MSEPHPPPDDDESARREELPESYPNARAVLRHARRVVALVVGGTLLLFGVALLFLPGPGLLGILAGLAVLATEFEWARRWLHRAREQARRAQRAAGRGRG